MKKLIGLIVALTFAFTLAACQEPEEDPINGEETSYLALDINPGVEFILNEDEEVVSIRLLNEDAEAVAANLELEGLPYDIAVERFIEAAIETGYIDVDSNENIVTVTADDEAVQEDRRQAVEDILAERKVGAAVFGGEINEEYRTLAEEHDISVGRARLISRAVEIDEDLTFEAALDLEHGEIMTILIDEHREKMDEFIEERRAQAQALKDEMTAMAEERVEAHRQQVDQDEIDTPDYDAIRDDVEDRFDEVIKDYEDRLKEKRNQIDEKFDDFFTTLQPILA